MQFIEEKHALDAPCLMLGDIDKYVNSTRPDLDVPGKCSPNAMSRWVGGRAGERSGQINDIEIAIKTVFDESRSKMCSVSGAKCAILDVGPCVMAAGERAERTNTLHKR